MKCAVCGYEVSSDAQFCEECGSRLADRGMEEQAKAPLHPESVAAPRHTPEEEGELFRMLDELIHKEPRAALHLLDDIEKTLKEAGQNLSPAYLGRFLSHANIAVRAMSEDQGIDRSVLDNIETALRELRHLFDASEFEDSGSYQKEVEIRPASVFRKAHTELRTFTRIVRKRRLDPELYRLQLNAIAPALERVKPGLVSAILGEISLQCLAHAGHLQGMPHADPLKLNEADRGSLGQVWMPVSKPVREAFLLLVEPGSKPAVEVCLFDYPADENPSYKIVITYCIEKVEGIWTVRDKDA